MTRTHSLRLLLPATLMLGACRDQTPTTPAVSAETPNAAQFQLTAVSAVLSMGWLSPLGSTATTAPQDQALRPIVTICRWSNGACVVGAPVTQFAINSGLEVSADGFSARWSLTASTMPLTRTTFRISVTNGTTLVGLPILVEAMRGRWALAVPGQTAVLLSASFLPLQFRLGTASVPPPPLAIVTTGVQSASTQFFPTTSSPSETRTPQQIAALTTLSSNLSTLGTALAGPPEQALLALTQARSAADAAFKVAPPGDKADLDVIRLELDLAGRLLGVSG